MAFGEFFAELGTVSLGDDAVSFSTGDTGLSLNRDGTSHSFMPLHELGARWEEAIFDRVGDVVELRGDGMTYLYRVPPRLSRSTS